MENLVETASRAAPIRHLDVRKRRFATVVLDVDSGISGIDGIEWLAARRGASVARVVAALTAQARAGALPPGHAYRDRLAAIRPHHDDMHALSRAYVDAIVPEAPDAIARLRRAGVRVLIVSHGPGNAMYRLADRLGFETDEVHAVNIRFDALGAYAGFDHTSRLATVADKRVLIDDLSIEGPVLVVGTGPAERAIRSFAQLEATVLP